MAEPLFTTVNKAVCLDRNKDNHFNSLCTTPTHLAAQQGCLDILKLFITDPGHYTAEPGFIMPLLMVSNEVCGE